MLGTKLPRRAPKTTRDKKKAAAQMFTGATVAPSTPVQPATMFAGPLQGGRSGGFDWATLAQGLGAGLLSAPNWGQGIGQGVMYARQFADQNRQSERDARRDEMDATQFDFEKQKYQTELDRASAEKAEREKMSAALAGMFGAALDQDPSNDIPGLSPQVARYGMSLPVDMQAELLGPLLMPRPPTGPQSAQGKLAADLAAGLIDKPTYDALLRKETYITPPAPQQPYSTNLITLVGPDGKSSRSIDSRDVQSLNQLLGQGWVERQNSMFPSAPAGYAYAPNGLAPIPGGPADPANPNNITADQRKTSSFAERLDAANSIISENEEAATDYIQSGLSAVPFFGNTIISSERQQVEQAQRDFINAQLRRESGATIQDTEFESARKQYFPQPGDSEAVVKQKRAARAIAIENMKREAGAAAVPRNNNSAPSNGSGTFVPQLPQGDWQ